MPALLRGCIALGAAPKLDVAIDLAPVDFVAQAAVDLSLRCSDGMSTFHLMNPRPVSIDALLGVVRATGRAVEIIPVDRWLSAMQKLVSETRDPSLLPLAMLMPASLPPEFVLTALRRTNFECRRTTEALRTRGIECPPADEELLVPYVTQMLAEEKVVAHR